jgi:Dyp-type peroxidase family
LSPGSDPLLDGADIQGNIIPGFRKRQQLFVAFSLTTHADMRGALRAIAPAITPLADVMRRRDVRKRALRTRSLAPPDATLWANVALSVRATDALGLTSVRSLDLALVAGMVPARTGDPTNRLLPDGTPNPAHPTNWVVGGPNRPLDLLLIFASDGDIEDQTRALTDAVAAHGLTRISEDKGALLDGDVEHFGFQDGISQPGVRGDVEIDGVRRPITTRYGVPAQGGFEYGRPGQRLADPDQFLVDPMSASELSNASLLVYRRLRQDVKAFDEDTAAMAGFISSHGAAVTPDQLRAATVGRLPSGQPLMRPQAAGAAVEPLFALNHFNFETDVPALVLTDGEHIAAAAADSSPIIGVRCPAWAHIRKVNPRDLGTNLGGEAETLGFQMLRRGIPFGRPYDRRQPDAPVNATERGLLFLSYQRSISQQFETLNTNWMNDDRAPVGFGHDLLVGQFNAAGASPPKQATFQRDNRPEVAFTAPRQWVTPTGGAYLFAPSISLVRRLASRTT